LMLLGLHRNINSGIDPLLMKSRWIYLKDFLALISRRVLAKLEYCWVVSVVRCVLEYL